MRSFYYAVLTDEERREYVLRVKTWKATAGGIESARRYETGPKRRAAVERKNAKRRKGKPRPRKA